MSSNLPKSLQANFTIAIVYALIYAFPAVSYIKMSAVGKAPQFCWSYQG